MNCRFFEAELTGPVSLAPKNEMGDLAEVVARMVCRFDLKERAMRVVVDYDLCESNAVCMGIAPKIFEVRDDDNLYVLEEHPDESMRPKVEEAVGRCPKQAISIVED